MPPRESQLEVELAVAHPLAHRIVRSARALLCWVFVALPLSAAAQQALPQRPADELFLGLLVYNGPEVGLFLREIDASWADHYTPMALETARMLRDPATAARLIGVMQGRTGESIGYDLHAWQRWWWAQPPRPHPEYWRFKRQLYSLIDPRFAAYFGPGKATEIRLDEVVWGGVGQDGIPPLRRPAMVAAGEAAYLADDDVVFALAINGDARAYPKRIMGWHEMFVDTVGGVPVAGVYCTLCGAMILYETTDDRGTAHELGTSGFLYRSNKLMYDRATQSLWSTMRGRPVLGALAGSGIELERRSIVTTTWGAWRARHPETSVLSIETGHERDYAEGAAYREYFATDELMFAVPFLDRRLRNKAEILGLYFPAHGAEPLAISADFLRANPVYQTGVGELRVVVLTDASGANRVYEAKGHRFSEWDRRSSVTDAGGRVWHLSEAKLASPDGKSLHRLPAHRAFWFGWVAAFPRTALVKLP